MQRMPPSSLRARNSEAQRCGQRWSITPTCPALLRKPISFSPSSISLRGGPSATSSDDIAAGIQYRRISSPITVPGPTRVSSILSAAVVMSALLGCRPSLRRPPPRICSAPTRKAKACPRSRRCAVTWTVAHPAEVEVLQRTGGTDPVADLGAARIELIARQLLQCARIFLTQRSDDFAIQCLIDGEVAQAARRHNPNAQRIGIAFDRLANGLAEPIAAPRRGLVGRVIGVEENWDYGNRRTIHDAPVDKGEGVALALSFGQGIGGCDVELAVDQSRNEMGREPRMHRIVPSIRILVVARRRALRPGWPLPPTRRRLARVARHVCDRLAAIDKHTRHEVVVIDFLLIVANDDDRLEGRGGQFLLQQGKGRHRVAVTPRHRVWRQLGLQ